MQRLRDGIDECSANWFFLTFRGMIFGVEKKNFDEIDSGRFNNFVKKNFDEIDSGRFNNFVKKNFDEIDSGRFNNFVKKNFDEIDSGRLGFNSFNKRVHL